MRNVVDLPAPLAPSRPKISPRATVKLTSFTATKSPKRRVRCSHRRSRASPALRSRMRLLAGRCDARRRASRATGPASALLPLPQPRDEAVFEARRRRRQRQVRSIDNERADLAARPPQSPRAPGCPGSPRRSRPGASARRACSRRRPSLAVAKKLRPAISAVKAPGGPLPSNRPSWISSTASQRSASSR